MEDVRSRILQLLQRTSTATVEQLSHTLALAPATVRRHLDILQRDSLISYRVIRRKAGRPEHAYYLTEQGQESLPKNYHMLLGLLVKETAITPSANCPDGASQSLAEDLLARVSQRVAEPHQVTLNGASFVERLRITLKVLSQQHFSPEMEDSGNGQAIRIRLLNCPFRAIALESPAVCSYDQGLIARLTDATVTQEQCIHYGEESCCYLVTPVP